MDTKNEYFNKIFSTAFTKGCHFNDYRWNQLQKCRQNNYISVSMYLQKGKYLSIIIDQSNVSKPENRFTIDIFITIQHYIDGLAQDCSNSIANALELLQSCTKPSRWNVAFALSHKQLPDFVSEIVQFQ